MASCSVIGIPQMLIRSMNKLFVNECICFLPVNELEEWVLQGFTIDDTPENVHCCFAKKLHAFTLLMPPMEGCTPQMQPEVLAHSSNLLCKHATQSSLSRGFPHLCQNQQYLGWGAHWFLNIVCIVCYLLASYDPISTYLMFLQKNQHVNKIYRLTLLGYDPQFTESFITETFSSEKKIWLAKTPELSSLLCGLVLVYFMLL